MTTQPLTIGPPARVLLATDLSARCDRALDRAIQLTQEWAAKLTILTVVEPRMSPDEALAWAAREGDGGREQLARQQLSHEVARLQLPAEIRIAEGDVAERIREVAEATDSDLVVTGMARDESFGRFFVGATVERLARMLSQPLLVTRSRAWDPYRRVLVATDFSEPSRYALQTAVRLFPDAAITVYHAFGFRAPGDDTAIIAEIEQGECARFLAETELPDETRTRLRVEIGRGEVATALPRYLKAHQYDLAVLGTHGRSHLMNMLIGRSAAQLLEWLPCDTMLVRAPR